MVWCRRLASIMHLAAKCKIDMQNSKVRSQARLAGLVAKGIMRSACTCIQPSWNTGASMVPPKQVSLSFMTTHEALQGDLLLHGSNFEHSHLLRHIIRLTACSAMECGE